MSKTHAAKFAEAKAAAESKARAAAEAAKAAEEAAKAAEEAAHAAEAPAQAERAAHDPLAAWLFYVAVGAVAIGMLLR